MSMYKCIYICIRSRDIKPLRFNHLFLDIMKRYPVGNLDMGGIILKNIKEFTMKGKDECYVLRSCINQSKCLIYVESMHK